MVERCIAGTIEYAPNDSLEATTYRQMIHAMAGNHRWATFGNDLCLGAKADTHADSRQQQFLPEYLMRDFDSTVAAAMDFADRTPGTLVVVTADHETGGLTIPSNEADFTRSESGLNYSFSTTGHTGTMVPVYLYGAGADRITGVMDNTQLSQRIMQLLGLE